ncbi:hypothetical protein J3458_000462 [Metarhizium acridum]|uniref:uncharacterized protein n=1 Tax=Metarhizium acridum TaxID=92637 RepID=UPI001C6D0718|nr:hypothetical protein J3458_000462 [Metarhizium acridum]
MYVSHPSLVDPLCLSHDNAANGNTATSLCQVSHYSQNASGNAVITDAQVRDHLKNEFGRSLPCVETKTDAAGLMHNFPRLVIQPTPSKNNKWQDHCKIGQRMV